MNAVNEMARTYDMPVLYSCHPRSEKMIEKRGFTLQQRALRVVRGMEQEPHPARGADAKLGLDGANGHNDALHEFHGPGLVRPHAFRQIGRAHV